MRWPQKLWRWFEERSRTTHAAIGFFILLVIAASNYSAGAHITLSMLFLIPVCYFAWFVGFKYGVFGTFVCVLMIAWWRWHSGVFDERFDALIWPSLGRIVVFLFVVLILARLKEELIRQRESSRNLLHAYEEIQKLSKIKDDFTARVSHDLRSPLAAMRESIALVMDGLAGDVSEEQKSYLDITKRSIDRLRRLIDSILDFAQLERGKKAFRFLRCDLRQILDETIELYRPLAEQKGVELRIDHEDAAIPLQLDTDSIHQVFDNLISNAMKYVAKGAVTVGAKVEGSFVRVFVKDTGTGIAPENLGRLFNPFEKLAPLDGKHREGTGLGLAISKQIIEQHGGRIWVESRPGDGTTFHFTLPLDL